MFATGMNWNNADGTRVELFATDKFLEYIKENGRDVGVETFEEYKNFIDDACGEGTCYKETINWMIKDGLVKYKYMRHELTDDIYTFLVKTDY